MHHAWHSPAELIRRKRDGATLSEAEIAGVVQGLSRYRSASVQLSYLQFPLAAANAVVLLAVVLMIIWGMTRLVDIRAEL